MPVRKITGCSDASDDNACWRWRPSSPGMVTSRMTQPGAVGIALGEEFVRRGERLDGVAFGPQQPRQRVEHAGVVIDDIDCEIRFVHWAAISISWAGSEQRASAPPPGAVRQRQLAAMRLDDRRTDCQAEAKAVLLRRDRTARTVWAARERRCPFRDPSPRLPPSPFRVRGWRTVISRCCRRRVSHGVDRIDDQIDQNLLQLHGIARGQRQIVRKHDLDAHAAADQFAVEQRDRRIDKFVELDRFAGCLALSSAGS